MTRTVWLALFLTLGAAAPALADATVFVGANTTRADRTIRGLSVGVGLLVVAFEVEYAATLDDTDAPAPALKTGSGTVLLQPPFMIHRFQPYVSAGAAVYREQQGAHIDTGLAPSTGAGVKIALAGPLRLRVDYRVFRLGSGALSTPAHRIYAGLNLKF